MSKPIVILGCTAAGKSDLAEGIAARIGAGGELMAVDSMQVYRDGEAEPGSEIEDSIYDDRCM